MSFSRGGADQPRVAGQVLRVFCSARLRQLSEASLASSPSEAVA